MFIQYALLAADIRFVAGANYLGIALANVCIAVNTWYLTRGSSKRGRASIGSVSWWAGLPAR